MEKIDIEQALLAINERLENLVADYLDVNRQHIRIDFIDTQICGEDYIDWDADPDDAAEGTESELYYRFMYSYRKDVRKLDYEEPVEMILQHICERNYERVMSTEEYDKLFEAKRKDIKSIWYEEDENE